LTGHVVFLPVEVTSGLDDDAPDFNPIIYKLDSRLIKIRGYDRNKKETATFFLDFDEKEFYQIYKVTEKIPNATSCSVIFAEEQQIILQGIIVQSATIEEAEGEPPHNYMAITMDKPICWEKDLEQQTFIEVYPIPVKWLGHDVRTLVQRQYEGVKANHDRVRNLRNAAA
jgi:hypothetical protein